MSGKVVICSLQIIATVIATTATTITTEIEIDNRKEIKKGSVNIKF